MITKNEARCLAHCLESVRGLVDEVVVVDTGSSDDTVAIAERSGARVGRFAWCDDFSAARNESLRLCTGDWVLVLDADEAVDALDHGKIRRALDSEGTSGHRAPQGYLLTSRNYLVDPAGRIFDQQAVPNRSPYQEGAQFPFYVDGPVFRLFRRFPDLRFEGRIHERADPYLVRRRLPIAVLDAVLHHYGKLEPAAEQAKKTYYLDLAERDAADRPGDADCQFFVMTQADLLGLWDKAIKAGSAVMRLQPQHVPYAVLITVARAHQELGHHREALTLLLKVLKAEPGHPMAVQRLLASLYALGRAEEARPHLDRARAAHPQDPLPWLLLGELEERCGRLPEARVALQGAVERSPGEPGLRQALIQLDLRLGLEAQAAADALEALRVLPDQGAGHWHALAAGYLLKCGHVQPGRAVLDLGLRNFPEHVGLVRLAAALKGSS
jgi:tetratricopeptide (TPR) repeat protein